MPARCSVGTLRDHPQCWWRGQRGKVQGCTLPRPTKPHALRRCAANKVVDKPTSHHLPLNRTPHSLSTTPLDGQPGVLPAWSFSRWAQPVFPLSPPAPAPRPALFAVNQYRRRGFDVTGLNCRPTLEAPETLAETAGSSADLAPDRDRAASVDVPDHVGGRGEGQAKPCRHHQCRTDCRHFKKESL